jgi:hypothetical protein
MPLARTIRETFPIRFRVATAAEKSGFRAQKRRLVVEGVVLAYVRCSRRADSP